MSEVVFADVVSESELSDFVYNLTLVAPSKGEAKKTVSRGFIRLAVRQDTLYGFATDDILSVGASIRLATPAQGWNTAWVTPENLKKFPDDGRLMTVEISPEFSPEFDRKFWAEHVEDSIFGEAYQSEATGVRISPDRLRKFGLLKPQGNPINWYFVDWADRDLIRWTYGTLSGVYVPLDHEVPKEE